MFVSYEFILFLLVLFVLYYLVPKKIQWVLLLIASFGFYYAAGAWYPVYILVTSFTVYCTGRIIGKYDDRLDEYARQALAMEPKPSREEKRTYKKQINDKKKRWMILCLLFNLGILAVTKYTNFVIDNVNSVREMAGQSQFSAVNLIVPLGISFYTFQAVGYLLDVYWGKCKPQKNFFKFALFVSFFPQLIQGPISRYGDLSKTLYEKHPFQWKTISFGIQRIVWGYFKKLVIADRMSVAVGMIMSDPDYYTGAFVFFGMLFYAVQLYADFTGGIDITIGIAQVFGISLEENFIRPFFSKNIAEYWRRWHITMGTWFRDYVFYPLSISKPQKNLTTWTKNHFGMGAAKRIAVYFSTIITWLATGIWHGAEWHFVVWGLVNGVVILISQELTPLYDKFHKKHPKLVLTTGYRAFQVIRTFLLMCCIRLFDNYGSVRITCKQYVHMFTRFHISQLRLQEFLDMGLTLSDYIIAGCGVLCMFMVSMAGRNGSVREKLAKKPYLVRYLVFSLLLLSVILFGKYGVGFDAKQFIYNQF